MTYTDFDKLALLWAVSLALLPLALLACGAGQ